MAARAGWGQVCAVALGTGRCWKEGWVWGRREVQACTQQAPQKPNNACCHRRFTRPTHELLHAPLHVAARRWSLPTTRRRGRGRGRGGAAPAPWRSRRCRAPGHRWGGGVAFATGDVFFWGGGGAGGRDSGRTRGVVSEGQECSCSCLVSRCWWSTARSHSLSSHNLNKARRGQAGRRSGNHALDAARAALWGLLPPLQVRAGCLEAVLGLAIYAKQHSDVWDAAAALLRDHGGELSAHRQQSLLENLLAAASQMAPADRARPGPGPPPLLFFGAPRPPPPPQRAVRFAVGLRRGGDALGGRPGSGPFLYDPFSAKREQARARAVLCCPPTQACFLSAQRISFCWSMRLGQRRWLPRARPRAAQWRPPLLLRPAFDRRYQALEPPRALPRLQAAARSQAVAAGPAEWVCGEVAGVEVEVSNPAAVGIRVSAPAALPASAPCRPVPFASLRTPRHGPCCLRPSPHAAAAPYASSTPTSPAFRFHSRSRRRRVATNHTAARAAAQFVRTVPPTHPTPTPTHPRADRQADPGGDLCRRRIHGPPGVPHPLLPRTGAAAPASWLPCSCRAAAAAAGRGG
jgi:hypothetical protein